MINLYRIAKAVAAKAGLVEPPRRKMSLQEMEAEYDFGRKKLTKGERHVDAKRI